VPASGLNTPFSENPTLQPRALIAPAVLLLEPGSAPRFRKNTVLPSDGVSYKASVWMKVEAESGALGSGIEVSAENAMTPESLRILVAFAIRRLVANGSAECAQIDELICAVTRLVFFNDVSWALELFPMANKKTTAVKIRQRLIDFITHSSARFGNTALGGTPMIGTAPLMRATLTHPRIRYHAIRLTFRSLSPIGSEIGYGSPSGKRASLN
jgi:hypothetical protein